MRVRTPISTSSLFLVCCP
ncbi:hypothetical protein ID866_10956 [Astraeus odoratus]|nr:hypothetical protein ID866_10956 [Astraeus odoratus]